MFFMGDTSSNGWFSIVMLVLWGVDENAADANQGDIMDQVHVAPASRSLTI